MLAPGASTVGSRGSGVVGIVAVAVVSGGSLAIAIGVTGVPSVVVLGPLVVISANLLGVVLVVVGLGRDGIVRLAPSGVVVLAVGLLGPLVVVVGAVGGTVGSRGTGDLASGIATIAVGAIVASGSGLAVGRGAVRISVLAPSLSAPLVAVLVVPFVVGLGGVRLRLGGTVRLLNGEVLVTSPGVPVGTIGAVGAPTVSSRGGVGTVGLGGCGVAPGVGASNESGSESDRFHLFGN